MRFISGTDGLLSTAEACPPAALQRTTDVARPDVLSGVRSLAGALRAAVTYMEEHGALPGELLRLMQQAGVFRMTMPRALGGLELDPLSQISVLEEIARHDASAAWVAMIGSDGGYYSAFLDPAVAAHMYSDVDAVTAGFVNPAGTATAVAGGYRVGGRWPLGSASAHATWFASGVVVHGEDGPALVDGRPVHRIAMLAAADVEVLPTWDALGLRGTSSNDYAARDVHVAAERTFSLADPPRQDGPLYRFPGMFLVNMAAVPLGTARAAIDEVHALVVRKRRPLGGLLSDEPRVQESLARAEAAVLSARCLVFDAVGGLWDALVAGDEPSVQQRGRVWLANTHAFEACRSAVELAVGVAGTTAVYATSPLQRHLRDLVTMNQHVMAQPRMLEVSGRMMLGHEPDVPFL